MKFSDRIKRFFIPSYDPMLYGFSVMTGSPNNLFPTSYITNIGIEICSTLIANTIASIEMGLFKEKNGFPQPLTKDPRYHMLCHNPNSYTNRFLFWHTMEKIKQSEGESFAIIHNFPETNSIELEFVHPMFLIGRPYFVDGQLKYRFRSSVHGDAYDASELIHFRRESVDGITPVRPYIVLLEQIKRMYLANKTITNYYEKDGKATKFIKTPILSKGDLAQHENSLNRFRKEAGGAYYDDNGEMKPGDFHKVVAYPRIPPSSEIFVEPNQQNDRLYQATVDSAKLEIAAFYQVSAHYLNILSAQKNTNIEALQLDFRSQTIAHTISQNVAELEMKLLKSYEVDKGYSIKYDTDSFLVLSTDERMKKYESLQKTAFITPNEVRKREGLPPIEGGDSHYLFNQMTKLEDINGTTGVTTPEDQQIAETSPL